MHRHRIPSPLPHVAPLRSHSGLPSCFLNYFASWLARKNKKTGTKKKKKIIWKIPVHLSTFLCFLAIHLHIGKKKKFCTNDLSYPISNCLNPSDQNSCSYQPLQAPITLFSFWSAMPEASPPPTCSRPGYQSYVFTRHIQQSHAFSRTLNQSLQST